MAALVQTLPPQANATMMSGRPPSSGGYNSSQASQHSLRGPHMSRYNPQPATGYRGMPSSGPVAPYAFTSTPQLPTASNGAPRHQSYAHAARSAQSQPLAPTQPRLSHQKQQQPTSTFNNTLSLDFSKVPALDLTLPTSTSISTPPLNSPTGAKPSPDRYRRNIRKTDSGETVPTRSHQGSAMPSGSGMAAVGQLYNHPAQSSSSPALTQYQTQRTPSYTQSIQSAKSSADDMLIGRSQNADLAARYRRRSVGSIETVGLTHANDGPDAASPHPNAFIQQQPPQLPPVQTQRPSSAHAHTGSSESVNSSKSARSSRPTSVSHTSPISATSANYYSLVMRARIHQRPTLLNHSCNTSPNKTSGC